VEIAWYGLLGLFFASYLVLGGYDYGTGLLLARTTGTAHRRVVLNAVGPFFLGNEVWLVAAAGILFGAFPMLEGELLAGLYPAVALALAGVITVTVSVQSRSRPAGDRARAGWDRLVVAGSTVAAAGWGAVLAGLLQGVPLRADGHLDDVARLLTPFVAGGALTLVALVAVHGAAFLALRMPLGSEVPGGWPGASAATAGAARGAGPAGSAGAAGSAGSAGAAGAAGQFARLGRRLVPAALAALGATVVVGLLTDQVRAGVRQPLGAVLLLVVLVAALLAGRAALTRGRPGLAFTATSVALATPVLLVGVATWPYTLTSSIDPAAGLTVADAAASGPTLRLLSWLVVPLLPALLGFQLMSWWVFRGRVDGRAPVYW